MVLDAPATWACDRRSGHRTRLPGRPAPRVPASTAPPRDGVQSAEPVEPLRPLPACAHRVGLDVTVHDPGPAPGGTAGALLAGLVGAAFAQS